MTRLRTAVIVGLIVFGSSGCASPEHDAVRSPVADARSAVTVTGPVIEVISEHAFVLGEAGGPPLLVLVQRADRWIRDGATVEVSGRVVPFDADVLGRQQSLDLGSPAFARFDGGSCLLARTAAMTGDA